MLLSADSGGYGFIVWMNCLPIQLQYGSRCSSGIKAVALVERGDFAFSEPVTRDCILSMDMDGWNGLDFED